MDKFKIVLPYASPSLNALIRSHWRNRKRLVDDLTIAVRAKTATIPKATKGERRTVQIVRHGPRRLDHDNLVGGCKPLVDALVRARLIYDDDPDHVTITYEQKPTGRRSARTVVTILLNGQGQTVEQCN